MAEFKVSCASKRLEKKLLNYFFTNSTEVKEKKMITLNQTKQKQVNEAAAMKLCTNEGPVKTFQNVRNSLEIYRILVKRKTFLV